MTQQILERVAQLTEPATLPARWQFVPTHTGVRCLMVDPNMFADELRLDFSIDELIKSHVFVSGSEGQPLLAPVFSYKANSLLFLARDQDGPPVDIVSQLGSLTQDDPAIFGCCEDFETRARSGNTKIVLATYSNIDLALLRQLKLPVTSAAKLETMSARQSRQLFGVGMRDESTAAVCRDDFRIVLVDWQVAALANARRMQLDRVIARLGEVKQMYHVDVGRRVGIWRPVAPELNRIAKAVMSADPTEVRKQIWKSILHSSDFAPSVPSAQLVAPNAFFTTLCELESVMERAPIGFPAMAGVEDALNKFRALFAASIVEPMLSNALAMRDPLKRSLAMSALPLIRHLYESSEIVKCARRAAKGDNCQLNGVLNQESLAQLLQVTEGLIKISRELTRNE